LGSVVVDPPFIHAPGKESVIGNRFSGYKSQRELFEMYVKSAMEIDRVVKRGALIVWKCQDIVESGKQVWNHVKVYELGCNLGWKAEDLFVLVAGNRMVGHNHSRQVHARKFHSFFWIFRKL
jgi:hypothetical protein